MYTSRFIFQIRIDCLGKIFFARYFHFVKGKQNIFRMFIKHFSIYFSRLIFRRLGRWEYVSDFVLIYTFIPLAWHLTSGSLLIECGLEKSQTFEISLRCSWKSDFSCLETLLPFKAIKFLKRMEPEFS